MLNLHRYQVGIGLLLPLLLFLEGVTDAKGQPKKINNPMYDRKQWVHFGITLGGNVSDFKIQRSQYFVQQQSIRGIESRKGPGFDLGIVSDLHLGAYADFRFIPTLAFAEKQLLYRLSNQEEQIKTVKSTYVDFPVHFKFKSVRHHNFRIYVIGGGKYSIDLASQAESRQVPNKVKVFPSDVSVEYGIGFDYYFPMFKFSTELKISHGVINVLAREKSLSYSRVLNKLFSRTFLLSFHFE